MRAAAAGARLRNENVDMHMIMKKARVVPASATPHAGVPCTPARSAERARPGRAARGIVGFVACQPR